MAKTIARALSTNHNMTFVTHVFCYKNDINVLEPRDS